MRCNRFSKVWTIVGVAMAIVVFTTNSASAAVYFTEDFSDNSAGPNMVLGPSFGSATTDFTGDFAITSGTNSRIYLGSTDTDYSTVDFVFDAEVTVPNTTNPWAIPFFGMGTTTPAGTYGEPANPRVLMDLRNDLNLVRGIDDSAVAAQVTGVAGIPNNTHRLRMSWNATTKQALFQFDNGSNGLGTFDNSLAVDGSDNGFTGSNSQLFVGGGNGLVFDNIEITSFTPPTPVDATISYVGSDTTIGANWRSTGVSKPANLDLAVVGDAAGSDGDPGGDDAYGTDGHFVFANSYATSLPAYISSATNLALTYTHGVYPDYDNPALPIGPTVADTNAGVMYLKGLSADQESDFVEFTLNDSTPFLLGVATDNWNGGPSGTPLSLRLRQITGGSADSGQIATLDRDADIDYYFFRVQGVAGDTFRLSAVNNGASDHNMINGIFFEEAPAIPEPSTFALAALGLLGLGWFGRRRRRRTA